VVRRYAQHHNIPKSPILGPQVDNHTKLLPLPTPNSYIYIFEIKIIPSPPIRSQFVTIPPYRTNNYKTLAFLLKSGLSITAPHIPFKFLTFIFLVVAERVRYYYQLALESKRAINTNHVRWDNLSKP